MHRALTGIMALVMMAAFFNAGRLCAQGAKTENSQVKAASYVAKQMVKENKGKDLMDDLQEMMASMMLACTLPEAAGDLEEEEDDAESNDDQATRRNRRNRKDREKQRRNRDKRNSNRRVRVRYRTRRNVEDIA
jgi:hypothetical protein